MKDGLGLFLIFQKMVDKDKIGHRQRLRERFSAGEKGSHTDESLLELALTYAIPQKDVQPLAKKLIKKFGNLTEVLEAEQDELCNMEGIKFNSAVLLKVINWIRCQYPVKKALSSQTVEAEQKQLKLFSSSSEKAERATSPKKPKGSIQKSIFPKRKATLFSEAVLKDAITLLPNVPDTDSLEEVRDYFHHNLHYSSEQTRKRYTSYITRRIFPNGYADRAIRIFSRRFQNSKDLREACFYRFIKSESLMQEVVETLIIPSIGNGHLNREKIRNYLKSRFPSAGNINKCAQAIVDALAAGEIAKVDRIKVHFSYREISIPGFAFVIYSEYPTPGMYDLSKLESNKVIRSMLWNPSQILPSIYELRNQGLISKVSEIDNIRQFTTKWSFEEAVENLIAGIKQ